MSLEQRLARVISRGPPQTEQAPASARHDYVKAHDRTLDTWRIEEPRQTETTSSKIIRVVHTLLDGDQFGARVGLFQIIRTYPDLTRASRTWRSFHLVSGSIKYRDAGG
ncbi:predicted protein [Aspergillus nidulans FGSC A4]|uniref:Uncharacterized protein n=1 Tax=Emericella nidulans (strain FGSC A4 / ATCC 38163 / CBS 112.46 / NRRL 194 / M139) TaxID=227321 RepID=Q5B6R8_EMENI|nr:hypothetical protein [Aspergillus nidulans FGSC A4]EAA59970.1 predicted protein [Aspergillus nidulans FGSC A4]CBF75446.1 TPA: conserved hypothetical protein [Aspergillus nidulans FGSC A4]|eukprot:XP_661366.1 predicted protein [Aspergillus nidulans FGSC A4]